MSVKEMAVHTVECYKNSTKCKVCGEVISKESKKIHLARWRNVEKLKEAIRQDHEENVSLHFDHGMDCNMQFELSPGEDAKKQDWTPLHYAAESGSLNTVLAMVSRGVGIDPTDNALRTPLMIAIE